MTPYSRNKSTGGFNKGYGKFGGGFGEKKGGYAPRKSSFGDKPMAHDAICDVCHKPCRVPFKPNGSKPVLCTNCFKKDRGAESSYSGKRSFAGRDERVPGAFGSGRPADNGKIEARLAAIEAKVDRILKALAGNDVEPE